MQAKSLLELLKNHVDDYLESLYVTAKAESTILKYTKIVFQFIEYIKLQNEENDLILSFFDLNKLFLQNYVKYMRNNGKSANTQSQHIIIVKAFINYVCNSDISKYSIIKQNLADFKVKSKQKKINSFSETEHERILSLVIKLSNSKSYLDIRDSCLINILLFTGLRANELLNLKWSDNEIIQHEGANIYKLNILNKGGAQDYVLISAEFIEDELNYLKGNIPNPSVNYIFVSHTSGNKLDRRVVYNMLKNRFKKINIFDTSIHKMRHTYANYLKNQGENLETIQKLCRHKHISTTATFYLDTSEDAKLKIANKMAKNR